MGVSHCHVGVTVVVKGCNLAIFPLTPITLGMFTCEIFNMDVVLV